MHDEREFYGFARKVMRTDFEGKFSHGSSRSAQIIRTDPHNP
jgi:hypothetical protein